MNRQFGLLFLILVFSTSLLANTPASESIPAEKSLGWLKNGNTRFLKGNFRKDGKSGADRKRLAGGQKPHTIVISCADSRVPPELVFDQSLGEIFVIRAAGEALDSSVIASAEYAVEHLGPKSIVVLGHTSCGAVKAAMETKEGTSAGSSDLDKLVADIKPRIAGVKKVSSAVAEESAANAKGVAADLMKRSEIIKSAVEKKGVKITPALYDLDSGVVSFF